MLLSARLQDRLQSYLNSPEMARRSRKIKRTDTVHGGRPTCLDSKQQEASVQHAQVTVRQCPNNYKSSLLTSPQKASKRAANIRRRKGGTVSVQPQINHRPRSPKQPLAHGKPAEIVRGRSSARQVSEQNHSMIQHPPSTVSQRIDRHKASTLIVHQRTPNPVTSIQLANRNNLLVQSKDKKSPGTPERPFTYAQVLKKPYVPPRSLDPALYPDPWQVPDARPITCEEWLGKIVLGRSGYEDLPADTLGKEAAVFPFPEREVTSEDGLKGEGYQ